MAPYHSYISCFFSPRQRPTKLDFSGWDAQGNLKGQLWLQLFPSNIAQNIAKQPNTTHMYTHIYICIILHDTYMDLVKLEG